MVAYICTHDNFYFIDKREIKDGIMKVVPVKFLKLSDDILLYCQFYPPSCEMSMASDKRHKQISPNGPFR